MLKGYMKYCYFLHEWESSDRKNHYSRKEWPIREHLISCAKNVHYFSLVKSKDILLGKRYFSDKVNEKNTSIGKFWTLVLSWIDNATYKSNYFDRQIQSSRAVTFSCYEFMAHTFTAQRFDTESISYYTIYKIILHIKLANHWETLHTSALPSRTNVLNNHFNYKNSVARMRSVYWRNGADCARSRCIPETHVNNCKGAADR